MVVDVVRALGRRWLVVIVGLIMTGALSYGAFLSSPPTYHARGLVLLLPSETAVGKGGNPFLQLSGLEQPAAILVATFSSASSREDVERRSPSADFSVVIDESTRGPVIAIDVTTSNKQQTMDTLNYLVSLVPKELARLQQEVDAPRGTDIGSMPLVIDSKAETIRAATIRVVIAALLVGVVATGAAAYAIDAMLQRRRLRTPEGARDEGDDDDFGDGSGDGDVALGASRSTPSRGLRMRREVDSGTVSKGSSTADVDDEPTRTDRPTDGEGASDSPSRDRSPAGRPT